MSPYFKYLPIAIFTLTLLTVACSNNDDEEENIVELINTDGFTTSNTDVALPETSFGNETECKQSEDDDFNAEFLALVNQHRKSIGLSEFSSSTIANYLAFKHTKYMICTKDFNHTNFGEIGTILRETEKSKGTAENIIVGYSTPQKMLEGWLSSPGHKKNIENPSYEYTGFSAIKVNNNYWATQNFYSK